MCIEGCFLSRITETFKLIIKAAFTLSRCLCVRAATAEMCRAAAANFFALGADGLYAWFFQWPLGLAQRGHALATGGRLSLHLSSGTI